MTGRVPYYRVIRGRGYWKPSKEMQELGFRATPCGPDGPQARAKANALLLEWRDCKRSNKLSSQLGEMARPQKPPKEFPLDRGYVYFFKVGGFVKIGFSKKPLHRIADLHVGQSTAADLMVAVKGSRMDEKGLHRALEGFHSSGEWFQASSSVMTVITQVILAGHASAFAVRRGTNLQRHCQTIRSVATG